MLSTIHHCNRTNRGSPTKIGLPDFHLIKQIIMQILNNNVIKP